MNEENKKIFQFTWTTLVVFLGSIIVLYALVHVCFYGLTSFELGRAERHFELYAQKGGDAPEVFSGLLEELVTSKKFFTDLTHQSLQYGEARELRQSISDTYERSYWSHHDNIVDHLQQMKGFAEFGEEFFIGEYDEYLAFVDENEEYLAQSDYFTLEQLKDLNLLVQSEARQFQNQVNTRLRYMAYAQVLGFKNNIAAAHDFYRLRYRYSEEKNRLRDFLDVFFQNFTEEFIRTASPEVLVARVKELRPQIQDTLDVYFEEKKQERAKRMPYVLAQEAIWKKRGKTPPPPPYRNRFKQIFISLADQYMFAYEDGDLVMSTPITSGRRDFETARGTFAIYSKVRGKYLESPFTDDEDDPEYYKLWVDYWMPFYGGYGIHDSCNSTDCWRTRFGGTNYRWSGSHGCVNTPHEQVAWLFHWAPVGTTVFVN